jgi:hypothetical protein
LIEAARSTAACVLIIANNLAVFCSRLRSGVTCIVPFALPMPATIQRPTLAGTKLKVGIGDC